MASWQLSQTLTSNSKPIRGMEERLELHLPQTAFPHLRQWCWRENRYMLRLSAPGRLRCDQQHSGKYLNAKQEYPWKLNGTQVCSLVDCWETQLTVPPPNYPLPPILSLWTVKKPPSSWVILKLGVLRKCHLQRSCCLMKENMTKAWFNCLNSGHGQPMWVMKSTFGFLGRDKLNYGIRLTILYYK